MGSSGVEMETAENRQASRDSLLLLVDLRLGGVEGISRIKVRNLSSGGAMGEGQVRVARGMTASINLRNIGWIEGTIAWVQDNRFGIAFHEEIDPRLARAQVSDGDHTPRFTRAPIATQPSEVFLRKI